MKFVMIKSIALGRYNATDKIMIGKAVIPEENYTNEQVLSLGVIVPVKEDFNLSEAFPIVGEYDSIQYRPKVLYWDKEGDMYYKTKTSGGVKKRILTMQERENAMAALEGFKKYLNDNYSFTDNLEMEE